MCAFNASVDGESLTSVMPHFLVSSCSDPKRFWLDRIGQYGPLLLSEVHHGDGKFVRVLCKVLNVNRDSNASLCGVLWCDGENETSRKKKLASLPLFLLFCLSAVGKLGTYPVQLKYGIQDGIVRILHFNRAVEYSVKVCFYDENEARSTRKSTLYSRTI